MRQRITEELRESKKIDAELKSVASVTEEKVAGLVDFIASGEHSL
jgi:hypothetical protein